MREGGLGFPAPPLGKGGIMGEGSEQLPHLTRVPRYKPKTARSPAVK